MNKSLIIIKYIVTGIFLSISLILGFMMPRYGILFSKTALVLSLIPAILVYCVCRAILTRIDDLQLYPSRLVVDLKLSVLVMLISMVISWLFADSSEALFSCNAFGTFSCQTIFFFLLVTTKESYRMYTEQEEEKLQELRNSKCNDIFYRYM